MTEQTYAVLDSDNIVTNLVVLDLDANPDWTPGNGLTLHTTPGEGAIGQVWDGSKFNDPPPPPPSTNPNDYPLQPYQFQAMLKISGIQAGLTNAISSMTDTTQQAIVESKLEYSTIYFRSDPLFDSIGGLINLTSEQIDTLWMQAKDL